MLQKERRTKTTKLKILKREGEGVAYYLLAINNNSSNVLLVALNI